MRRPTCGGRARKLAVQATAISTAPRANTTSGIASSVPPADVVAVAAGTATEWPDASARRSIAGERGGPRAAPPVGVRKPASADAPAGSGSAVRGDAVAARHDHEQRAPIHERELLPEEPGIRLGLVPELGDRPEIGGGGDDRDPERVPTAGGGLDQAGDLALLSEWNARILGQEQRLGGEDVARRIAVRACLGGEQTAGKCQHEGGRDRLQAARGRASDESGCP